MPEKFVTWPRFEIAPFKCKSKALQLGQT